MSRYDWTAGRWLEAEPQYEDYTDVAMTPLGEPDLVAPPEEEPAPSPPVDTTRYRRAVPAGERELRGERRFDVPGGARPAAAPPGPEPLAPGGEPAQAGLFGEFMATALHAGGEQYLDLAGEGLDVFGMDSAGGALKTASEYVAVGREPSVPEVQMLWDGDGDGPNELARYLGGLFGSAMGDIGTTAGISLGVGAVSGPAAPVTVPATALAMSVLQNTGDVAQQIQGELEQQGADPAAARETAHAYARIAGPIMGALDLVGLGSMQVLGSTPKRMLIDGVIQWARRPGVAGRIGRGALGEAATEAMQGVVSETAAARPARRSRPA